MVRVSTMLVIVNFESGVVLIVLGCEVFGVLEWMSIRVLVEKLALLRSDLVAF